MDLDKSFSINCIWEACKLVDFWIDIFLDISEEIIISLSITTKSIWEACKLVDFWIDIFLDITEEISDALGGDT
jgi:hypothetical protein